MQIEGKYGSAKIFAKAVEPETLEQVRTFLDQDFIEGAQVRIMPDCHVGAGCVIGFTADLGDKVIPNIVGVDIGCGMLVVELGKDPIDLHRLDRIIHKHIPTGRQTHEGRHHTYEGLQRLHCFRELRDTRRMHRSVGTLGGGNHFIEIDVDEEGNHYLVIHSGSRNLGKQVADHYQRLAVDLHRGKAAYFRQKDQIITDYKAAGRRKEIPGKLKEIKARHKDVEPAYPRDLCYLYGEWREDYLHDMKIAQHYAALNRETMAQIILDKMWGTDLIISPHWHTVHNYIDHESNIIRKGAISAKKGEKILIPLNMRDGALVCVGKGNPEWNESAPHGAGRIMSRRVAQDTLALEAFEASMEGIFSSSIGKDTLDEAPMAYKPMEEIVETIGDTAEIIAHLRPIYNFKAKE